MDDILAKKNRHLFLEEKDNQNNSFIGNINDVANRKTELDTVAAHIENVDTVGDHIDNVDTVANNISDINDAVDNIATVKTFNDNVNNGTMQYLLEAFTTSLNEQGNAWEVRLTQLGESILATTSAFNYSTVITVSSDIPANGTLILPNSMKYKVGTHMLMVSWNGTVCYAGEQYDEVGAYGVWATSIKLNQPAKAGDKIQLRIVALTDQSSYVDITEAAINASQFVASGSNTERYLPEFLGDVVNVKNFGAIGNGINDDTTAFQSAIVSGKAVFVPEGTYKLNTNLNGVFCGVGNSTFTGGTVNSSTVLRGIAYKKSDIINVKDFGAKGDGTTDNTDAITAAAATGKTLFFPAGTYKVDDDFVPNFFRVGEGKISYTFQNVGDCIVKSNPAQENLICTPDTYQVEKQDHYYAFVMGDVGNLQYNVLYCTGFNPSEATSIYKNTVIGSCNGKNPKYWSQNTIVGHGAFAYSEYADRNTAVGSETCTWLGCGSIQKLKDTWNPYWHGEHEPGDPDWDVTDLNLETLYPGIGTRIAETTLAASQDDVEGNCCLGRDTLVHCVVGGYNTILGYAAGSTLYAGSSNTFIGASAGKMPVFCDACISIGRASGTYMNDAYGTICIGNNSAPNTQEVQYGIFIGHSAASSYTPPANKKSRPIWIGGNAQSVPVYSGYGNYAGIGILPEDIRAPFHVKGETSGSSLAPTTGSHLLVEGGNYSGIVIETNDTGSGFIAFANTVNSVDGMIQYSQNNKNFTFRLNNANALRIRSDGTPYPETSGGANLGRSDKLWGTVYAQTGTINTSDEREKANIADPDDAVFRAWSKVRYKVFQLKDSIAEKGQNARLHVGIIAQDIAEAFSSEGIDAARYGLFCYDEWGDEYEDREVIDKKAIYNEDGTEREPAKTHIEHDKITTAGNRYGIRYEEALALECAYQRWLGEQRDAKIEALMQRISALENNH